MTMTTEPTTVRTIVANGGQESIELAIREAMGDSSGDEATDLKHEDHMWNLLWAADYLSYNPGGENLGYVLYEMPEHEWFDLVDQACQPNIPRPLTDGNLPHVGQEVALAGPRPGTGSDHGRYVGQTNGVPVFYFAETSREEFVPKSDEITWVAR